MTNFWMYDPKKDGDIRSCGCIGPQNGDPVCPCAMRSVTIENGRYVRKEDLGPVNKYAEERDSIQRIFGKL